MIRKNRKRRRQYESYIRGPLPSGWFKKAESISGAALTVGLMLWKKAYFEKCWGFDGQSKESEEMILTDRELKEWGTSRAARDRVLKKMHDMGLIRVQRHPGRSPRIQIIDEELLNVE